MRVRARANIEQHSWNKKIKWSKMASEPGSNRPPLGDQLKVIVVVFVFTGKSRLTVIPIDLPKSSCFFCRFFSRKCQKVGPVTRAR